MLHMGKGRWFLRPVGALQNALVQILRNHAIALASRQHNRMMKRLDKTEDAGTAISQ